MKNIWATLLLLLPFAGLLAQVDPLGEYNRNIAANWKGEFIRIGQYKVKGSPFLMDQAFSGSIKYFGGKSIKNVNILYDLYNQKAGIEDGGKKSIFTADEPIEEFIIKMPSENEGQILLFRNGVVFGNAEKATYYNVIQDGDIAFLKLFKIKLIPDPNSMLDKEIKIFDQYAEYYLYSKKMNKLEKIRLRIKDVSAFTQDDIFIKNQVKLQNLDVSKETGMSLLIYAINTK
jgi:hypothetical protein